MSRRPADRVSLGVEALRRLPAEDGPIATITRARVLEREQGRGRRRLPVFALGLAAPLVISGALAAAMLVRRGPVPAPAVAPAPNLKPHGVPQPPATLPDVSKAMPAAPSTSDVRAEVDTELTAYGAAHAAHFGRKDPAQALRLWTAYLQRYPKGRFVPEAAYNRALTLVRLGRDEQAVAALKSIAAGRFGDYRRQEAEALLGALAARAN